MKYRVTVHMINVYPVDEFLKWIRYKNLQTDTINLKITDTSTEMMLTNKFGTFNAIRRWTNSFCYIYIYKFRQSVDELLNHQSIVEEFINNEWIDISEEYANYIKRL